MIYSNPTLSLLDLHSIASLASSPMTTAQDLVDFHVQPLAKITETSHLDDAHPALLRSK